MAQPFKKGGVDIYMHADGLYGPFRPAVNVKVQKLPWTNDTIAERFHLSAVDAEKVGTNVWDTARESFWEYWCRPEIALEYFGKGVTISGGGRSCGWLEVDGLPEVEKWDAILLGKWRKFSKEVLSDVAYRSTWEYTKEMIDVCEWAEQYEKLPEEVTA